MSTDDLEKIISRNKKEIIDSISIRNEIADWKREHDGSAPTILVDLNECIHMFVLNDQIGVILGGHYDRYNKMMRQFLENITEAGAKLVFFIPGRQQSDDLPFFIPRTEEAYIESLQILDKIEENPDSKLFLHKTDRLHAEKHVVLPFNRNFRKLVSGFGDFHVTYGQHSQEIARYAKQNARNILALITDDLDFMAFTSSYEIWRAKSISFKELTCKRYNKDRLYDRLGFDYGAVQMQLLNAMSGTNFLPEFVLDDFLDRLANVNDNSKRLGKVWNVSAYVKRQPLVMVGNRITYDFEQISRDIFGDGVSSKELNAIVNGLVHYDLDFEEPTKSNSNAAWHRYKNRYPFIYKLGTEKVFNVQDIAYMDYRNYKSKSYAELVIPILMKLYGILFKDDARPPIVRKICMKHAHDEPSKVTEEAIIYPSMELPKLSDLVFETKERPFDEVRWSLLEWILDLEDGIVKKVRRQENYQRYAAVIITLLYLVKQKELTAKEANIILYTEYQNQRIKIWNNEYPEQLSAHYVRIAHLYVRIYVLVSHCLDICGLRHMTDLLRFDGAMFHKNMEIFEEDTKQLDDSLKSAIQPIWIFS